MLISIGDIETTRKSLEEYLKNTLGSDKYNSLVSTQNFRILLQLISIAINYSSIAQSVARRESYIETAQDERSIFELIYNYGYLYPPQIPRTLKLKFDVDIALYEPIGMLAKYLIIPVKYEEDYVIAVIGVLEKDNIVLSEKGSRIELKNQCKFLSQYDRLVIKDLGSEINLCSDLSEVVGNPTFSVLRGMLPYRTRIYFGDGNLGFFKETELEYIRVSFDNDVNDYELDKIDWFYQPSFVEELNKAYYYSSLDQLRTHLKYLSIDGRLVRELDFESWIPFIWNDVLSVRVTRLPELCCEIDLELICDDSFYVEKFVKSYVDARKLIGLKVNWIRYSKSQGDIAKLEFYGDPPDHNTELKIKQYFIEKYGFKLMRENEGISVAKFTFDINKNFGLNFLPKNPTQILTPKKLVHTGFFKDCEIEVIEV